MSLDIKALREAYVLQYASYKDLVVRIRELLAGDLHSSRLTAALDGRAKDPASFLQKAIRKHAEKPVEYADPLSAITDKAGVRVIVNHLSDAQEAGSVIQARFEVLDIEDTRDRYKPHELGYLGVHFQVRLRDIDLGSDDLHLRGLECEIQVHTKAQNAWSAVSHPLLYKPAGGEPSQAVATKVMRAVALVSLFDEQVEEARIQTMGDPSYRPAAMLSVLQKEFVPWMERESDEQLSLAVLAVVQGAYTEPELQDFERLLQEFVQSRRGAIDGVFQAYSGQHAENPLLFQPESLALYERSVRKPSTLRSCWVTSGLPLELLELIGEAFSTPVT